MSNCPRCGSQDDAAIEIEQQRLIREYLASYTAPAPTGMKLVELRKIVSERDHHTWLPRRENYGVNGKKMVSYAENRDRAAADKDLQNGNHVHERSRPAC